MWSMPFVAGEGPDPDEVFATMRRHSPPDNELGASVGLDVVLVRTPDLLVALGGFRVYSTGVSFDVQVLLRETLSADLSDVFFRHRHRGASGGFLFGVELPDGRRATVDPPLSGMADSPGEPLLTQHSGGGGGREYRLTHYLSPVPPPGPLTFYVLSEELGVAQTATTIDATVLADAVPRVVELWPWRPEPDAGPEPVPPVYPPGSWFAAE